MVEPHCHCECSEAIPNLWHAIAAGAPRPRNDDHMGALPGAIDMYARRWGDQLWTLVPSAVIVGAVPQPALGYPNSLTK